MCNIRDFFLHNLQIYYCEIDQTRIWRYARDDRVHMISHSWIMKDMLAFKYISIYLWNKSLPEENKMMETLIVTWYI